MDHIIQFRGYREDVPKEMVKTKIWGFSSAGRAPALQAGGQRFDPANLHQKEVVTGQELSWLEHTTDNREVDGSSPFWPTTSYNAECKIKRLTEIPTLVEISLSLLKTRSSS